LKLAAFDQSKLGMVMPAQGDDNQRQVTVVRPPQTRMWDEAQKQLDEAMKSLKNNPNLQPEALKKQLDEAMSKASDALKSAQDQMRGGLNQMRFRLNQNGDETVTIFPGQNGEELPRLLEIPAIPQTPRGDAGTERRMEALERKLDNLNKRMDEIRDLLKEKQGR
jgi:cellobiose-specific phosphotransferase system component IIA